VVKTKVVWQTLNVSNVMETHACCELLQILKGESPIDKGNNSVKAQIIKYKTLYSNPSKKISKSILFSRFKNLP